MKHARSTMRKPLLVLLLVAMLAATLGTSLASAANDNWHSGKMCTYWVKKGDTLSGIAVRFDTTVHALAEINDIDNVRLIRAGSMLWVPCDDDHPVVVKKPVVHKPVSGCVYKVKSGDTLSGIAVKFETTVDWLEDVNHICNPNRIFAGTWLRVPCDN